MKYLYSGFIYRVYLYSGFIYMEYLYVSRANLTRERLITSLYLFSLSICLSPHSRSLSLALCPPRFLIHSLLFVFSLSLVHSLLSHSPTHSFLSLSFTHSSLSPTLPPTTPTYPQTHIHSLIHSLTHSLTHSPIPSFLFHLLFLGLYFFFLLYLAVSFNESWMWNNKGEKQWHRFCITHVWLALYYL